MNNKGPFSVGEVCVIIASSRHPELIGAEVTITGPKHYYETEDGVPCIGYSTDLKHKGRCISPPEFCLERKLPKRNDMDQKVNWTDCAWAPNKSIR